MERFGGWKVEVECDSTKLYAYMKFSKNNENVDSLRNLNITKILIKGIGAHAILHIVP